LATLTCPGCAAAVQQDDLICFTCGANLPRPEEPDEPTTPPTVMQESLRRDGATASSLAPAACPLCGAAIPDRSMLACPACHKPLPRSSGPISPVVLRLSFPTGNVDVPAGTSLVLGRDPGESLVAAAFFHRCTSASEACKFCCFAIGLGGSRLFKPKFCEGWIERSGTRPI